MSTEPKTQGHGLKAHDLNDTPKSAPDPETAQAALKSLLFIQQRQLVALELERTVALRDAEQLVQRATAALELQRALVRKLEAELGTAIALAGRWPHWNPESQSYMMGSTSWRNS